MDTTNYQIHLPDLPDSWNRLSTEELEEVNRLYKRKEAMAAAGDEERADRIFKLKCFMLFLGLKIVRRTVTDEMVRRCFSSGAEGFATCLSAFPCGHGRWTSGLTRSSVFWTILLHAPSLPTELSAFVWEPFV